MKVSFLGEDDDGISVSSHHARALSEAGVHTRFDPDTCAYTSADGTSRVIHLVARSPGKSLAFALARAMAKGIPVVRYWTNRSALWAKYDASALEFARMMTQQGAINVARSDKIAESLKSLGIIAKPIPVLSLSLSSTLDPTPLPSTFTALCYLPSSRREFCGGAVVDRLILRFPAVRFFILGDAMTDYSGYRNVESIGVAQDMSRVIKRSTVLIEPRLDRGLSRLALEVLSHGRHVISTHADPLFCHADSVDGFADALRMLQRDPRFNLSGREAVCRTHDRGLALAALKKVLQQADENRNRSSSTIRRDSGLTNDNLRARGKDTMMDSSNPAASAQQAAFQVLRDTETGKDAGKVPTEAAQVC